MDADDKKTAAVTTGVDVGDSDDSPRAGSLASRQDAITHLHNLREEHQWDPNLPDEVGEEINEALEEPNKEARVGVVEDLMDNSPYPEVRAAVANYDEGGHANTIRAWTIGLVLCTIGSALNMLFSMRQPYITIPSYVANVVAFPLGCLWAKTLPNRVFNLWGLKFNLNPGPFSKKEHSITVIMANATFGGGAAYG